MRKFYFHKLSLLILFILFFPFSQLAAATLTQFGAVGDGITNDTQAIRKAFASDEKKLDGEGKTYRVIGTLEIKRDVSLKNIRLIQGDMKPSLNLTDEKHPRFKEKLYTRTLLIRAPSPNQLKINLDNIFIHRGADETQGLPSDSAGIWLDRVTGNLKDIEITGNGSGMGIMVVNSS